MPTYQVKLKSREEAAAGTMAFHWKKPRGFEFQAGQYGDWTLTNPTDTDEWSAKHSFTIASAPYEDDLIFTTRMRDSAFKHDLLTMELGTEITLEGPNGEFCLHDDASIPAVFLTGGIGVTPVRSIVLQAIHDKLPHQIYVFYSNRRPEDAAYLDELMGLREKSPGYRFIPTMTKMEKSNLEWHGETGAIDLMILSRYLDNVRVPIYYIDGPPDMVKAMRKLLLQADVDEKNIRTEEFEGY